MPELDAYGGTVPPRVLTTHAVRAMSMCVDQWVSPRVPRYVTEASNKNPGFYWYLYTCRDQQVLPQ
jgi:hypothetical protein